MKYNIKDFQVIPNDLRKLKIPIFIREAYSKLQNINNHIFCKISFEGIPDFYMKDEVRSDFFKYVKNGKIVDELDNVLNFITIKPFVAKLSEGFYKGYFDLENNIEKEVSGLFQSLEKKDITKARKVFETAIKHSVSMTYYMDIKQVTIDEDFFVIDEELFFNNGIKHGEFYKAWYIILNNSEFFEQFFNENEQKNPDKQTKEIKPSKQINISEEISNSLFELLKKYFNENQKEDLKKVLAGNGLNYKLTFLGTANKLTHVFWYLSNPKKAYITDNRKDIETWICDTFQYMNSKKVTSDFKIDTVHKDISTQTTRCQKPIPNIETIFT